MVASRLRHVELPHDKKERWLKLKDLYSELEGVQTANDLAVTLQRIFEEANNDTQKLARERSKDAVDSFGPNWHFKGLEVFLEEIATREESETFFKTTLPFIVTLASSIEEFAPSEGILLCSQLQGMSCESKYCLQSCHYYVVQMIPSISLKTIGVDELCLLEIRNLICTTLSDQEVSLVKCVLL